MQVHLENWEAVSAEKNRNVEIEPNLNQECSICTSSTFGQNVSWIHQIWIILAKDKKSTNLAQFQRAGFFDQVVIVFKFMDLCP